MKHNIFRKLFLFFILLSACITVFCQRWNPNHSIGTVSGKYAFDYNHTPDQLVEIDAPAYDATGVTLKYQWESSPLPLSGFTNAAGTSTQSSYTFTADLAKTIYFRRKTYNAADASKYVYSNTVKIQLVSVNWEDLNYVREQEVLKTGTTTWQATDGFAIGDKLQTTTYADGLGRPVEKVSRETATPASGSLWGDVVQFSTYDAYGRETKEYLPYTTTNQSGKYKTTNQTDQPTYYTSVYNETSAYSAVTFDNSPLNRITNVKSPGTSWAAGLGNSATYDVNTAADNVKIFSIGYNTGDYPVLKGTYPANTLYKITHTDENGKKVIEYINTTGQLILKKVQLDDNPSATYTGWICTYSVYDEFGRLRYQIQPEAVKYLDANGWSFAGTNGSQVLDGWCFRYEYDEKGRTVLKKAPGADPLRMLYDVRDRVVFMQDGNQAKKSTPEWTANLYDELDRIVITTLYRTSKTVTNLQTDINNAVSYNTITITNGGEPIVDLVVDKRDPAVTQYTARNSITFTADNGGSFTSTDNDNWVAEIKPDAATPPVTATVTVFKDPISSADLNNPSVTTILKYQFYDNYSFAGVKAFDTNFDNTTAYSNSDPNVIPIAASKRTTSYPTGSMVRVLGTNTFLASTEYYDEKGRHIQTLEDNIKQGQDVTTFQYHWDGRLLSTHGKHSTAYSGYSSFSILTKNVFDKLGRVTSIQKKYGSNAFKTIATYDLDEMGRLKTKHLDPGYTGSGKTELEGLSYSYNIHNNITGINKDYVLKTAGKYDKWGNFFGLYLGYDNRDNVFAAKKLDGHVTGLLWSTQGDDVQRKYDYTYDNAGRLTSAVFKEKQKPADAWDNSKIDFSVNGSSGKITYDLNGNLLSMLQKGVIPGTATPVNIDNLAYTYIAYSNRLKKVTDNTTQTTTNGQSGDFKDGTNGSIDDYVYDDNGNLVVDNNKGASSITYNFLDKPEQITLTGKGTIKIVYDAEGNKLQKIFTPQSGGQAVTTTYINEYVYKENDVAYINFEEGRLRVITPVSTGNGYDALVIDGNMALPNNKEGVYDYFIRDYQQNVRMVLTEEVHNGSNKCTMETARASAEEPVFGQTGSANEVSKTRYDKPVNWQANTSGKVSRLGNLAASKTGPNVLLKVMAGDVLNAAADYYYQNPVTNGTGNNLTTNVLTSLIDAITGSSATSNLVKGASGNISSQLSGNTAFTAITAPDANNVSGTNPKAYLTILFFDERFNYVGENSTSIRVSQSGDGASPLVLANIKAPKNGYVYAYLSNESDEMVYFDNFNVALNRGRIIEEGHYYAFGLKIAAISSQKLGDSNEGYLDNKNLYNDKELIDDADLDWYDYGFRSYDTQIGRFTQLDPLTWDYPELTNYQYAGNEPIANVDLDGLEPCPVNVAGIAAKAASGLSKAASIVSIGITTAKVSLTAALQKGNENFVNNWTNWGRKAGNLFTNGFNNMKRNLTDPEFWRGIGGMVYNPNEPFQMITGGPAGIEMKEAELLLKNFEKVNEISNLANEGFKIEGQLKTVFSNKKYFSNWLKGNQSLSRVTDPLSAAESQQIIDNAKKLGLRIESNLKGLQGLEVTGEWAGVPHFKVGNVHIPIQKGSEGLLKF